MKKFVFFSLVLLLSFAVFPQTIELFAQTISSNDDGYLQINDALMVAGGHYQVPVIFSGNSIVGVESTIFCTDGLHFDFENRNTVMLNEWYFDNSYSYPILVCDPKTSSNTVHWGLFSGGLFNNYFTPVKISVVVNENLGDKYEEYFILGQTIFTSGNSEHSQYYASTSSAKVTVFNDGILGGDNGTLDIFKILDFSTGKVMVINQKDLAYYDVTGDLKVNSQDALYKAWKLFNVIDSYPVETGNYYYDGGCGLGIAITKGEVIAQQQSNNSVKLIFSDSLTNGDLSFRLPKKAWIEKGSGFNVNNSISNPKDGITKMSFITNNPLKNGSSIIVHGAKVEEISLTGTLNNGKSVILKPSSVTDVPEEIKEIPQEFALNQNYPNPFNPSTTISYQLPTDGFVTLKVYDAIGKEVATLVNEEKSAGNYEVKFNASELASGMYIYRLSVGSFTETKKMTLVK